MVADECPTALVETIDGKTVVNYYEDTASAIKAMQDSTSVNGRLIATLDSNKMATSIIIVDTDAQGTIIPPATASDGTKTNATVVDVDTREPARPPTFWALPVPLWRTPATPSWMRPLPPPTTS